MKLKIKSIINVSILILIILIINQNYNFEATSLENEFTLTSRSDSNSNIYDNWSEANKLSAFNESWVKNPDIEVYNNNIHVIWEENYNIYYRKSEDSGKNWSEIKKLVDNIQYNATTPDIAVEGEKVYVVWVDEEIIYEDLMGEIEDIYGEIYYKYSLDNGESWSNEIKIIGYHSHFPAIDVINNKIHIVWSENTYGLTAELYTIYTFKILYNRFEDGNWGIPYILNESSEWFYLDYYDSNPIIKVYNMNIHVVWRDLKRNDTNSRIGCILYTHSDDEGNNWKKIARLSHENISSYAPKIDVFNTNIFVTFLEGNNIKFVKSSNGGEIWNISKIIGRNSSSRYWDNEGPDISVNDNKVFIVWSKNTDYPNEDGIYLNTSFDCGMNWNKAVKITDNSSTSWNSKIKVANGYLHFIWVCNYELYYKYHEPIKYAKIIPYTENTNAIEDQFYNQSYSYLSTLENPLIWNFHSNATWLSWGQKNHTIWGIPRNDDVGQYWVKITIKYESKLYDEQKFTLTVINVNDRPVILGAPKNITVIQYQTTKLNLTSYIYDVDNPKSDLKIQTNSNYVYSEGLELVFNYRDADLWFENITINVTDGELVSNNHYFEVNILIVDDWYVEVEDCTPKGSNVSILAIITITFNRLMNHSTCENAFSINPLVDGSFYWDYNILIFEPTNPFDFNTTYVVTIDNLAVSIESHPLNEKFSWNFTTEKLVGLDRDDDGYLDIIDKFPSNPLYHLDTDSDGMPDAWEDEYGLNKSNPDDAIEDPDKDGKLNKNEFDDGTNPLIYDGNELEATDYTIYILINIIAIAIIISLIFLKLRKKKKKEK